MKLRWDHVLASAGVATAATIAATLWLGRKETGSAVAPINATSHIAWGDEAAMHNEVDAKHTLVGGFLHLGAMAAWGFVHDLLWGRWITKGSSARSVAAGMATSSIALITDYALVPKRLTPGFEKRLSKPSLAIIYCVLALGLAVGSSLSSGSPLKERTTL